MLIARILKSFGIEFNMLNRANIRLFVIKEVRLKLLGLIIIAKIGYNEASL